MKPRNKLKPLAALLIFALGLALLNSLNQRQLMADEAVREQFPLVAEGRTASGSDVLIAEAFREGRSNLQLGGVGAVAKILPDDNKGSRHQRFLLQLESGHTLLIAHNIDLAPRVEDLRVGGQVEFYGEYEWNNKGGVIHWTHHDPKGKHPGGWLKHQGRLYK